MLYDEIRIKTEPGKFYNITAKVEEVVKKFGVKEGLCIIHNPSTTSFVFLQEDCELLKKDMEKLFERIAPRNKIYTHPDNAHSHLLASVFSSSTVIPIVERELSLGTWQEILFYEGDTRNRERRIKVVICPLE